MPLVGWILIIMAATAVISVLYMVMREHQETEEYFIPPRESDALASGTPASGASTEARRKVEENA
jgi:hypothetical protein